MLDQPVVRVAHVLFQAETESAARDGIQRVGADTPVVITALAESALGVEAVADGVVVVQDIGGTVLLVPGAVEAHDEALLYGHTSAFRGG
jgi:hypothetical protein